MSHNNSHTLLANALRDKIISTIGLWEYYLLDDDGGTSELRRRLNDGENGFVLDLYPLTSFDLRPAFEKWGHPPRRNYMPRLQSDSSVRQAAGQAGKHRGLRMK